MNSLKKPNILEVLKPGGGNKRAGGDSAVSTVNKTATEYLKYYGEQSGDRKDKAVDVTNHYYDLVTDFYEYGWGESFHFAVHSTGESREHSFAKHEYRVALKLQLQRGETALDIGCGVGGPARHIASFTNANVIGVNINDYQLKRARVLTKMANLEHLCSYVKADFTAMPFDDNTFAKVYAIESTCHCAQLSKVYAEVFRVLKPGGLFVSYEWIATDKYQPSSQLHKDIVAGILEGDGLPRLNTVEDVHEAVRVAGFELVEAEDHAVKSEVPWYHVLQPQWTLSDFKITPLGRLCTSMMLSALEMVHLTPRGATKVHRMLCKGADNLVRGGQEGIFSPMYFVVMRKPAPDDT